MPRELVKATRTAKGSFFEKWLEAFYVPSNYQSGRTAIFKHTGNKLNGDLNYDLIDIVDDYKLAKSNSFQKLHNLGMNSVTNPLEFTVCLLELPIDYDDKAKIVKRDDDVIYYNAQKTGIEHDWTVSFDSDCSRFQNCVFNASKVSISGNRQLTIDYIDVAMAVLKIMKFYYTIEPEIRRLTHITLCLGKNVTPGHIR